MAKARSFKAALPKALAVLLFLWAAFWLIFNAHNFSVTNDETVYGPVGVRMLLKGDKIYNPEHPPLNKILAGLFLIPLRPNLDKANNTVTTGDGWRFGEIVLYESGNPTNLMMFVSRMPTVILTLIMIVFVWLWTRRYFGEWASVGAVAALALNPNILANGALTTNDMHLTVAVWLLSLATFYLIARPEKIPRYVWFGLALGLALIAKFSGVFFAAAAAVIGLVGIFVKKTPWQKIIVGVLTATAAMLALVWVSYMVIEWRAVLGSQPITVSMPRLGYIELNNRLEKTLTVPFFRYKQGLSLVAEHNKIGQLAYLDGKFSWDGFRTYFLKALWYKTPTVLLILAVAGVFMAAVKRKWALIILSFIGIVFVGAASFAHIDIGIRHILPVYVLFASVVGFALEALISKRMKGSYALLALAVFWWAADLGLNSPNKISYFSEISGGWRNGYRHLSDSNTDWGQESKIMIDYVTKHPDRSFIIGNIALSENPGSRGVTYLRLNDLGPNALCSALKQNQTLLVSVNVATGLFGSYPCVYNKISGAERLGDTFLIFDTQDAAPHHPTGTLAAAN